MTVSRSNNCVKMDPCTGCKRRMLAAAEWHVLGLNNQLVHGEAEEIEVACLQALGFGKRFVEVRAGRRVR